MRSPSPPARSVAPAVDDLPHTHTDSFTFSRSLLLVLLLVAVDFADVFGGSTLLREGAGLRYLLLLFPLATALLLFASQTSPLIRRPASSDLMLVTLSACGLLGSLYGRFVLSTDTSAFPIFLPMLIAVLYVVTIQPLRSTEASRLLRWLSNIGLVYVLLHASASSGILSIGTVESYGHWKAFFIAMAITAAMEQRRLFRVLILACLAGYIYSTYPAGTYVFVLAASAVTLYVTTPGATPTRALIVALTGATVLMVGLMNTTGTISLAQTYFRDVGKQSNVDTRLDLWTQGIQEIRTSPIVGHVFTGEMTVPISIGGVTSRLALHEDYLNLALGGGMVALGLFVAWAIALNAWTLRHLRTARMLGHDAQVSLLRVLLVGFNSWLVVAAFNPLLESVGTSMAVFAIYGLIMTTGLSRPPSPVATARLSAAGPPRVSFG